MPSAFRRFALAARALPLLAVGAAVEGALADAASGAATDLRALGSQPAGELSAAFADVATITALLAWSWLMLLLFATLAAGLRSATRPDLQGWTRHLAPKATRQGVVALLGLGTALSATNAVSAVPYDAPHQVAAAGLRSGAAASTATDALEGLPLPDRPTGGSQPTLTPGRRTNTVVVQPGDTLWSIAAHTLGDNPTASAIAANWPRWYAANRAVIGDDPDLLLPDTVLEAPAAPPAPRRPNASP